jgi:hypothetical protein
MDKPGCVFKLLQIVLLFFLSINALAESDSLSISKEAPLYWKIEGLVGALNDSCTETRIEAIEYFNDSDNIVIEYGSSDHGFAM